MYVDLHFMSHRIVIKSKQYNPFFRQRMGLSKDFVVFDLFTIYISYKVIHVHFHSFFCFIITLQSLKLISIYHWFSGKVDGMEMTTKNGTADNGTVPNGNVDHEKDKLRKVSWKIDTFAYLYSTIIMLFLWILVKHAIMFKYSRRKLMPLIKIRRWTSWRRFSSCCTWPSPVRSPLSWHWWWRSTDTVMAVAADRSLGRSCDKTSGEEMPSCNGPWPLHIPNGTLDYYFLLNSTFGCL